jgi:four helix bundle protein
MDSARSFTQLNVWQKAHQLVINIYLITKTFPVDERFGITDQMRRAAVSITSNISEGFNRKSKKEKTQFYYISLGSLSELENQLLICKDIGYLSPKDFNSLASDCIPVGKMLNGLIKSLK